MILNSGAEIIIVTIRQVTVDGIIAQLNAGWLAVTAAGQPAGRQQGADD